MPDFIIVAVCFFVDEKAECDIEFPHMTLMQRGSDAPEF